MSIRRVALQVFLVLSVVSVAIAWPLSSHASSIRNLGVNSVSVQGVVAPDSGEPDGGLIKPPKPSTIVGGSSTLRVGDWLSWTWLYWKAVAVRDAY